MEKKAWTESVIKLFEFFRVDKLPTDSQMKIWFEMVKHIADAEVQQIVAGICQDCDTLPRNIPKAFTEHRSSSPSARITSYDPIEDLRFPIDFMHRAFDILANKGNIEFERYCNATGMPRNDRDRVRYKVRVCRAGESPYEQTNNLISNTIKI